MGADNLWIKFRQRFVMDAKFFRYIPAQIVGDSIRFFYETVEDFPTFFIRHIQGKAFLVTIAALEKQT